MAKIDVLDILRSKKQTPLEFDYDNLLIPPMWVFLSQEDIDALRKIATSLKLSSKIEVKYKMIDDIMRRRGFKRFSAGTNRVVYSFLEDNRFVVKIAVDRVGMQDNPLEYKNQVYLRPYCAKMFYISPCGTVGFAERVLPIKSKDEFREIAGDVFDIIVHKILGDFVMEDIGTKYFMNWGIRKFYAPVLLDYPFLYKLDGKKIYCTKEDPITGQYCNGEIDYDVGFNHLVCQQCGKIYLATDLRDNSIDNKIIIKGGNEMKMELRMGDRVISTPIPQDEVMTRPKTKTTRTAKSLVVQLVGGEQDLTIETDKLETETESNTDNMDTLGKSSDSKENSTDINNDDVNKEIKTNDSNTESFDFDTQSKFISNNDSNKENQKEDNSNDDQNNTETSSEETSEETTTEDLAKTSEGDESANQVEEEKESTPEAPSHEVVKKKSSKMPERDANGRFVSNKTKPKQNKGGTTRIPAK